MFSVVQMQAACVQAEVCGCCVCVCLAPVSLCPTQRAPTPSHLDMGGRAPGSVALGKSSHIHVGF